MTAADENLQKIEHIVVLMMENRSFGHMLGFLTIEQGREEIEGPTLAMKNDCRGESFRTSNGLRNNLKPSRPYNLPSFVRHLEPEQWRWYSHDYVPILWLIDPEYGLAEESVPATRHLRQHRALHWLHRRDGRHRRRERMDGTDGRQSLATATGRDHRGRRQPRD